VFPTRVGFCVTPELEECKHARFPRANVQRGASNLADVDTQLTMHAAALNAKHDAEIQARPIGFGTATVGAGAVPWN